MIFHKDGKIVNRRKKYVLLFYIRRVSGRQEDYYVWSF